MKYFLKFNIGILSLLFIFAFATPKISWSQGTVVSSSVTSAFTDAEIKERLGSMKGCMPLKFTPVVRSYVRTYVMKKPAKAKAMLGKRLTYFDLFEQKLKEHGLPEDLKYLAVVESALNPIAVSRSGARGLWQFMPATGKSYGLRISSTADQRSDPVRSTDAACRYLKRLYKSYGDWTLALAAYNSGPGNVNKAIRRSHSRNFWKLKNYLPRETRSYVPAFIAASYICNHYAAHDIQPDYPPLDMQLTSYIKVFEQISFDEISSLTSVDRGTVKALNPSYTKNYIPASTQGNYVILPFRVMNNFVNALNKKNGNSRYSADFENRVFAAAEESSGPYSSSSYYISNSDHISRIATSLNCNDEHLIAWNKLKSPYVAAGTFLEVWRPILITNLSDFSISPPTQYSTTTQKRGNQSKISQPVRKPTKRIQHSTTPLVTGNPSALDVPQVEIKPEDMPKTFQYHTIRRNESLMDVAEQYNVDVRSLIELNPKIKVKVGNRVKIKAFN